jgi:hypothetical protein
MSRLAPWLFAVAGNLLAFSAHGAETTRMLDAFDTTAGWKAVHTDDVSATLRAVSGKTGKALCLDYDFHGVSGAASIRKTLPVDFPDGFALGFDVRGAMPPNTLQLKLIDDTGDNVWWFQKPSFVPSASWQTMEATSRQVEFAWGPLKDRTLRHTRDVEFVVYKEAPRDGATANRARCASTISRSPHGRPRPWQRRPLRPMPCSRHGRSRYVAVSIHADSPGSNRTGPWSGWMAAAEIRR